MIRTETLNIRGMTCSACVRAVERAVGKVAGVQNVAVNFATEKATVTFEPEQVRLSDIKGAVDEAGYQALPDDGAADADEHRKQKEHEIRVWWTKFTVSAGFSIPLLYLAMGGMLGLPLPSWLHPMDSPRWYSLLELVLVLPVLAAGYRFYTVGFRAILKLSPNMDSLVALGTSAAFLWSLGATVRIWLGDVKMVDELYFETAGLIITLILLGKTLEAVTKGRTSESIKKLMGLTPKTATLLANGVEREIDVADVEVGDRHRGPPRREDPRRRRNRRGYQCHRRVDAHGRKHARGQEGRRQGVRRQHEQERPPRLPDDQGGKRHGPRPNH